jgi:hypothetical protein
MTLGAKSKGNKASNQTEFDAYEKDADSYSTIANVSLIAGGIVAATGVVFVVLDMASKKSVAKGPFDKIGVAAVRDARGAMTPMLSGTWRF